MDFGDIGAQVQAAGGNVMAALGLGPVVNEWPASYDYATNKEVKFDNKAWQSNLGYGFRVVRVDATGGIGPAAYWSPFVLQIPPQDLDQEEIFAIEVTATFRGVVVEHQGSTLKDIRISGTTGISPFRTTGGVLINSGRPVLSSGRSGYEEFNKLRSYFRAYVEQKRTEGRAVSGRELRLIFDNFKDAESLFVEPQRFTMQRTSASPMTYKYDIQLRSIGLANFPKAQAPGGLLGLLNTIQNIQDTLTTAQQYIQAGTGLINKAEATLSLAILGPLNAVVGIVNSLATGINTVRNFGSGLSSALNQSLKAGNQALVNLQAAATGRNPAQVKTVTVFGTTVASNPSVTNAADQPGAASRPLKLGDFGVTRASLADLAVNVGTVRDNLIEAAGTSLTSYNAATGITSTMVVPAREPTILELQTIHGLQLMQRALNLLQADPDQFAETVADRVNQVTGLSNGAISIPLPGSYRITRVLGGDNLQTIAARELGDPARYVDLVVLNNLVPPYVAAMDAPGVLAPGDQIFIPLSQAAADTGNRRGAEYPITAGLTEAEKALGVDLQLGSGNDLQLTNLGDLALLAGMLNFVQAMVMATNVEKGALQRNPGYGVDKQLGEKLTTARIATLRGEMMQAVLSDPRTESVPFIDTSVPTGDEVVMTLVIKPLAVANVLPLPISVQGG